MEPETSGRGFILKKIIAVLAVAMSLFHLYAVAFVPFPLDQLKNIHLFFGLVIFYLISIQRRKKWKFLNIIDFLIIVVTVLFTAYIHFNYYNLAEMMGIMDLSSTIIGVFLVAAVWEGARRDWGAVIPVFVLLTVLYAYFGKIFPGALYHGGISFDRIIGYSSMFFRGIYGSITGISASMVFVLFVFVSLLEVLGGSNMFMRMGQLLSSRFRSGPAQSAVICSAFMGSLTGSAAANVASTGSFTIPMMKHTGYKPEFAGAVESVASTGGQIMPPVMGAAAFIMVGITGIPYVDIIIAALLPALLYYFYVGLSVELHAQKEKITVSKPVLTIENDTFAKIFKDYFQLMLPIVVMIYFLVKQYAAGICAVYATITLVVLVVLKVVIVNRDNRLESLKNVSLNILSGLKKAPLQAVPLLLFFACVNIGIEMLVVTGVAQKFSHLMFQISGGSFILLLILAAITAIIFGMGMPTPGAYILVALLGAPALAEAGSTVLAAHLFVLFYAVLSCITPPVAVAPMIACGIAESNFWATAIQAVRLGLPGFLLPFLFMYRPALLIHNSDLPTVIYSFLCAGISLACLSIANEGYLFRKLRVAERIVMVVVAVLLIDKGLVTSIIGFGILLFLGVFLEKTSRYTPLNG